MKHWAWTLLGTIHLVAAFSVATYHAGVFRYPLPKDRPDHAPIAGRWIDRSEYGMHQLILRGSPYARGLESGRLTAPLLLRQEQALTTRLFHLVPSWVFVGLEVFAIRIFAGVDRYLEPWMVEEMAGVAQSAPHEFDFLADGFTRQLAYHGLHEVGQMMVDQRGDLMGCTVVALPGVHSWTVGRNFDFEGGEIFDREKILKWVFPDEGHAFVSVIWAGMVGAVTGVNDQGLYVSLNAAGSEDHRRIGTPSTLVLLKILQYAKNADEALAILQREQMFITDLFVVVDARGNRAFRVEKSPHRIAIREFHEPSIVANHLIDPIFANDRTNAFRRDELTSIVRQERGESILADRARDSRSLAPIARARLALEIVRDKGVRADASGNIVPLALGNRNAIDPLIASHSVIYDGETETLYVGQGPSVSGAFTGFDLAASFRAGEPVRHGSFAADPLVSETTYRKVKDSYRALADARELLGKNRCDEANGPLSEAARLDPDTYDYLETRGDYFNCRGDRAAARSSWESALGLAPAYRSERNRLERKLDAATTGDNHGPSS